MISMQELIKDKVFREYMRRVPRLGVHKSDPWVVYIQKEAEGPWARKTMPEYSEAFRLFSRYLKAGVHDAAIQCRPSAFRPPHRVVNVTRGGKPVMVKINGQEIQKTASVPWRPKLGIGDPHHTWCGYCRRPTVFKWFTKHHALDKSMVAGVFDTTVLRCTICGVSESFLRTIPESFLRTV